MKRRAGVPNWSSEVHTVSQVTPTQVTDQKGNKHDTRLVLPVPARSSAILAAPAPLRQDRRQTATQRFVPDLTHILLRTNGATLSAAARAMAAKQGFTQTLRDQRMTFRQFVDAHPNSEWSLEEPPAAFSPRTINSHTRQGRSCPTHCDSSPL